MRTNKYKEHILKQIKKKHLVTISEIHKAIPDADYSTIFRNVEQLLKDKKIKKIMIDNKSVAYESSNDSHDHFICNDCGVIESIHISRKSIQSRRKIDDVTVRGSCNLCNK